MAEQTQNQAEQSENNNEAVEQSGGSLLGKLKTLAFIAAVVFVECALAYVFIPGRTADAQSEAAVVAAAESNLAEKEAEESDKQEVEIDMGEYRITSYQPATDTTFRVNFHLFITVVTEEKEEFEKLKVANDARLREQVNVIIRAAEISDLTDPTLSLIKRRILDKINRILGKPLVKGVFFSDMLFVEQ